MKDQEVTILMNDLAADYDMLPAKYARGSLDGKIGGLGSGVPRLTRLVNAIRFPSFLLFLFGKELGELHRQVP